MGSLKDFLIPFDALMAAIFVLTGYGFWRSDGRAARYIAGFNSKSEAEQRQYDTGRLCADFGRRMVLWSLCFIVGSAVDCFFPGIGSALAWGIWLVLLIRHVVDMSRHEDRYKHRPSFKTEPDTKIAGPSA